MAVIIIRKPDFHSVSQGKNGVSSKKGRSVLFEHDHYPILSTVSRMGRYTSRSFKVKLQERRRRECKNCSFFTTPEAGGAGRTSLGRKTFFKANVEDSSSRTTVSLTSPPNRNDITEQDTAKKSQRIEVAPRGAASLTLRRREEGMKLLQHPSKYSQASHADQVSREAHVSYDLGILHMATGNLDGALQKMNDALRIYESLRRDHKHDEDVAFVHEKIGDILALQEGGTRRHGEEMQGHYDVALRLYRMRNGVRNGIVARILVKKALAFLEIGETGNASDCFRKALSAERIVATEMDFESMLSSLL